MYKDFKIALSGGQGSGKSSLAFAWSEKHGVPLSKSVTQDIMAIFGFQNHKQVIKAGVTTPEVGIEFQKALATEKLKEFVETEGGIVSDRGLIDIFTYYALHNSAFAKESTNEEMKNILLEFVKHTDLIVFLSPKLSKVEDNGVRINSSMYYETVSSVMYSTMNSIISTYDSIEGIIQESFRFKDSNISAHISFSPSMAILHIDESGCKDGIASVSQRIEVIESVLEDLERYRGK